MHIFPKTQRQAVVARFASRRASITGFAGAPRQLYPWVGPPPQPKPPSNSAQGPRTVPGVPAILLRRLADPFPAVRGAQRRAVYDAPARRLPDSRLPSAAAVRTVVDYQTQLAVADARSPVASCGGGARGGAAPPYNPAAERQTAPAAGEAASAWDS